ncbi:Superfamily II DNA and RNA helicase [Thalassospira xiamenensis M-5 = DSM 17429]|uniref:DEAD-box ATP-dependent RNA helicase RhpA n=1 Tax=Thalassospira xiamenensis M-5 = DSM 17429 TaxID=1123366 RepID=A0AB72UC03_9PROT|nr:DEAD/DEAH box helicase [Thalassospira xiamenensis]AJD51669.1 DEAD/DEAH box helicase [Thalassospira xiamenensis M-5 = DSM 17429]SIT02852.1 Superfamily II DNA and RNA helicase [Thalassospira xiamenensis M-5 = DSM 17429]
MNFADLGLSEDILKAVADAGYDTPTPIQSQAIPSVLMARDILGCAQTGTGKTAGFVLPMLDILHHGRARMRMPRSIILEPTRELATQVAANFDIYGKYMSLSKALIIGGESFVEQQKILEKGADVIIATPGRLIDTFERGKLLLSDCKLLVIDEADRMLDMGFIPDIEKIVNMLPKQRQTLFFSATMPKEIRRLADKFLSNPKEITVSPPSTMATTVEHKLLVMDEMDKREALRKLVRQEDVKNAFVFCNRKKDVDILFKSLTKHGFNAGRMHGDLVQSERTETLDKFKTGEITLLICSDVAARGIDVADVSHVFNFDVPFNAEDYVHRTGRTGRAGRAGKAFMLAVPEDGKLVAAINKSINMDIPLTELEGIETLELDFTGKKRRVKKSRKAPQRDASPRSDRPARSNNRNDRAERDSKAANAGANAPAAAPEAKQQDTRPAQQPRDNTPQRDAKPRNERSNRPERQDRNDRSSGRSASRRDRDDRYDRHDRHDRDDKPVIGFADHTPAFLLTPVPASSLGKPRADEVEKKAPARKTSSKASAEKVTAEKSASEKTGTAKTERAKPTRTRTTRATAKKASPAAEPKDEAAAVSAPAASTAPAQEPASAPVADDAPAKEEKPKAARRPRKKPAPKKAAKTETAADAETTGSEG